MRLFALAAFLVAAVVIFLCARPILGIRTGFERDER